MLAFPMDTVDHIYDRRTSQWLMSGGPSNPTRMWLRDRASFSCIPRCAFTQPASKAALIDMARSSVPNTVSASAFLSSSVAALSQRRLSIYPSVRSTTTRLFLAESPFKAKTFFHHHCIRPFLTDYIPLPIHYGGNAATHRHFFHPSSVSPWRGAGRLMLMAQVARDRSPRLHAQSV